MMIDNWIKQLNELKSSMERVDLPDEPFALYIEQPGSGCRIFGPMSEEMGKKRLKEFIDWMHKHFDAEEISSSSDGRLSENEARYECCWPETTIVRVVPMNFPKTEFGTETDYSL